MEDINSIYPRDNVPIKLKGFEFFAYRVSSGHYKKIVRQSVDREIALSPSRRFKIEQQAREFYSSFSSPFRPNVFAIQFPGYWIGHSEETHVPKAQVIGERIDVLRIGDFSVSNEMVLRYHGKPFLGVIFTYIPGFDELEGTVHFGSQRGSEEEETGGGAYNGGDDSYNPWKFIRNITMLKEMREKNFPEERWYDITVDLKVGTGLSTSNFNPFRRLLAELIIDFARKKRRFIQSSLELEYNPPENFHGEGNLTFFIYFVKVSF